MRGTEGDEDVFKDEGFWILGGIEKLWSTESLFVGGKTFENVLSTALFFSFMPLSDIFLSLLFSAEEIRLPCSEVFSELEDAVGSKGASEKVFGSWLKGGMVLEMVGLKEGSTIEDADCLPTERERFLSLSFNSSDIKFLSLSLNCSEIKFSFAACFLEWKTFFGFEEGLEKGFMV